MGGFALAQMDVDIGRLEDEGIITGGARITTKALGRPTANGSLSSERVAQTPVRCVAMTC